MEKLIRRSLILAMSFVIFILLFVYYKNVNNSDTSSKVMSKKSQINIEEQFIDETCDLSEELLVVNLEEKNILQEETKLEVSEIQQEEAEKVKINPYELIVNSANADTDFIDTVVEQINLLPEEIIESFAERGYTICITNEKLAEHLVLKNTETLDENLVVWGLLDRTESILYLSYDDTTNNNYTVIHEFGHYVDYYLYGNPSSKEEFSQIYEEEKQYIQPQTEILIKDSREFYAEVFKFVILKKDNSNSKAWNYVKDSMEK